MSETNQATAPSISESQSYDAVISAALSETKNEETAIVKTSGQPATEPAIEGGAEDSALETVMKGMSEEETTEESTETEPEETSEDGGKVYELLRDGKKHQVSLEEMRELAQKGHDYQYKTAQVAEQRKIFEAEKASYQQELAQTVQELEAFRDSNVKELELKQTWDVYLNNLKTADPNLFNHIVNGFQQMQGLYNNPIISQQINSLRQENQSLKKNFEEINYEKIRNSFQSEMANVKAELDPALKQLKMNVDWEAVTDAWKEGAKDVKTAFYAVYGDELRKRSASRGKIDGAKKAVEKKPVASGGLKKSGDVNKSYYPGKNVSYSEIAAMALRDDV